MAKKKSRSYTKQIIIFFLLVVFVVGGGFLYKKYQQPAQVPSVNLVPTPNPDLVSVLAKVAISYPSASWSNPVVATQSTPYGMLKGAQIKATITSPRAYIQPFVSTQDLSAMGFDQDNSLAANGAGGGVWGYKRLHNNSSQILLFIYQTQATISKPNEPLQFNCPCKMDVTAFISNPW